MNKSVNENDQYCSELPPIYFFFSQKITLVNMQSACENRAWHI